MEEGGFSGVGLRGPPPLTQTQEQEAGSWDPGRIIVGQANEPPPRLVTHVCTDTYSFCSKFSTR